jgi:hypothetical protein
MGKLLVVFLLLTLLNSTKAASQLTLEVYKDTVQKKFLLKPLPQNFYNHGLGFFCKKELQFQKLTRLPVFFRLGSREYADYMEKKPNSFLYGFKKN